MRKLGFALTMFAISATAADFRALDIGQSCGSAREWEVAQGSTPMPGSAVPGADIYAFEGREFDRDVYLSYFCMHGTLFTGNYSFPIESLDQAVDSYRDIRERLLSVYGETSSDASPWSGAGDMRSTGIDSPKYMTFWRTAGASTTLSLMRNKPSEKPGWRVFLVIGPVTSKATSQSAPPEANSDALTVRISEDGVCHLLDASTPCDQLGQYLLTRHLAQNGHIHIAVDRSSKYELVAATLESLRGTGFKVGFVNYDATSSR